MVETVESRDGYYRGQPYELRVRLSYGDTSHLYDRDTRIVEVRTKRSLTVLSPSADVDVMVRSSEAVDSYEKTFLWWTLDSHEARSTEDHISAVMAEFERRVCEKLERHEEVGVDD